MRSLSLFLYFLSASTALAQIRFSPMAGLYVSNPQKLSASIGLIAGEKHKGLLDASEGILIEVEPGLGGIRGYIGRGTYTRPIAVLGMSGGISYLRTWRNPWYAAGNRHFVGGAADMSFFFANLRLGLFGAVDGKKNPFLLSVSGGIRF